MLSLLRARLPFSLLCGLTLASLLVLSGNASAADGDKKEKDNTKRYPIKTVDGVELEGTYYLPEGDKKEAVILMLHDFDVRRGGNSHQPGFVDLAKALQKEGYGVLTFDFRGFGKSTTVNPKKFWSVPVNAGASPRGAVKMNESINHTEFAGSYYPQLVNDIAAAKAFLDRKNDAKDLNSSNIIVIGAGQGATLGAIWMASEFHRKKVLGFDAVGRPMLDGDSEGKDLAAAIWISISSTLGGRSVSVSRCLQEITSKDNKVRTAFIFGSGRANEAAKNLANNCWSRAKEIVARKPINSALAGSSLLLANKKDASSWIIKPLLPAVIKARGDREWRRRKTDENAFFWVVGRNMVPAKLVNEEIPRLLPGALINR